MNWGVGILLPAAACLVSGSSAPNKRGPLFEDVSTQAGLDFWHFSGATGKFSLPEIMGSGAALLDYDNDGDLDLYLVQGSPPTPDKPVVPPPEGWKPGNRLFRNNLIPGGKLAFTDVSEIAGVGFSGVGM